MTIFDKIIASGYYAFNGELTSHMVRMFITLARKSGKKFKRDELKMSEVSKYMEFSNAMYVLKKNYAMSDISEFIDFDMVIIFYHLQKVVDKYFYSKKGSPTFEEAMKNIEREESLKKIISKKKEY